MQDFQNYFVEAFSRKKHRNVKYSWRQMAADLKVSPAFLSQMLSGTRSPSDEKACELTKELKLSRPHARRFLESVRLARLKNQRFKSLLSDQGSPSTASFTEVKLSDVSKISSWIGLALFELIDMVPQSCNIRSLARRLGVSEAAVAVSLDRLLNIGLIEESASGYRRTTDHVTTPYVTSSSIKDYHRGLLRKAEETLYATSSRSRDFSSIVMGIDPTKLPEAIKRIEDFRRDLMAFLESGDRTELYAFSAQLFRLDKEI